MKIVFQGLIAHVKVDNRDISRAVLVAAPGHVPKMVVTDHDIVGTPTFPRLFGAPAGETWFDLSGQQVRVVGLPSGPTIREISFDTTAPALSKVLMFGQNPKKLDDDVHGSRLHPKAFTYIDLTGGALAVDECFKKQAIFDGTAQDDPKCLAKYVAYETGTFPDTMIFTGNNSRTVEVNSTANVNVFNTSGTGIHFHMFQELAGDNAIGIRNLNINPGKYCTKDCVEAAVDIEPLGADLECTNSHWP